MLQVWAELMRTRTLSLDDMTEPKAVSVAWVQAAVLIPLATCSCNILSPYSIQQFLLDELLYARNAAGADSISNAAAARSSTWDTRSYTASNLGSVVGVASMSLLSSTEAFSAAAPDRCASLGARIARQSPARSSTTLGQAMLQLSAERIV